MTGDDGRLLAVIARGSTPWERIGGGPFAAAPVQDAAVIASRRTAWIERAARGDAAAFAQLLAGRGLALPDWEAALADVTVTRPGALPGWAAMLLELFADFPDGGTGPLDPLRRAASRPVLRRAGEMGFVAAGALDGLVAWLDKRLLTACAASLRGEARLRAAMKRGATPDVMALPADRGAWLARFERQSALAALVGTVMHDWRVAMDELLCRLAADMPAIATTFFGGADPGTLHGIDYGTGDPHRGGRSVAILTFDRGKLLYKPKDLRAAAALERLLRALAADGVPDLACPLLLPRGDYAWEGFVAKAACRSAGEADRFYGRLGAWARVFQLLGSIDFWFDNLIAQGERPMFIDFETIMHPPAPDGRTGAGLTAALGRLQSDSPVRSGILPWLMPTRLGADPSDLGCLAVPGEHRTPLPAAAADGARVPGATASSDGMLTWQEDGFAPRIGDRWADAGEHFAAFEQGYAAMHGRLGAVPAAVDRFLAETGDAPLRYILIDTWSCYRLIDVGTVPGTLSDGVRREIALEGFWPAYPHVPPAIGRGIIDDLRRLDVPMLECRADSRALSTVSGDCAPAYFDETAAAGIRTRLQAISPRILQDGIASLRTAYSTRPDRPRRARSAAAAGAIPARLDSARAIGRTILAAWHAAGCDPQGIVGLAVMPAFGIRSLAPLRRDILSGTAGLVLFLSELHCATGDADAAECALALAEDLYVPPWHGDWGGDGYGAVLGLGARLRAIMAAAAHLGRPALIDRALPLLDLFPGTATGQPVHVDWCGGIAGLLAVLAPLHRRRPDLGCHRVAARAIDRVRSAGDRQLVTAIAPSAWLSGLHRLPTAACGWRIAAHHWPAYVTGDVLAALAPVLHDSPAADAVGDLRASLALPAAPDLADRVRRRVREPAPAQPDDDRAAGLLDRLTLALSAMRTLPDLRADAEGLADRLAAGHAASGSWFADDWAEDVHRLSAVDGIAAIGRAMLRLA